MTTTTRRAAFGAIGSIAAAGLIAGQAAHAAVTPAIEQLWTRFKAVRSEIAALDIDDDDATTFYWSRLTTIEDAIVKRPDNGTRTAEIKLWIALDHSSGWIHSTTRQHELVIAREDAAALKAMLRDLDFDAKAIASAILALRGEA